MRSVLYWLRIGGLAAAMMAGAMLSNANGDVIVTFDLSVVDQVTFSATSGTSLATVTGSDGTGVYFKNFFETRAFQASDATRISGDFVYFNATSDNSPEIFRSAGTDPGLNLYSLDNGSPSPASFTVGVQAFKGSATYSLTSAAYASFLQAPTTGDIFAFADGVDDLSAVTNTPQLIGQYSLLGSGGSPAAVPEPGSMAITVLGALGFAYRSRRKLKE